jgi:hypothetical protein
MYWFFVRVTDGTIIKRYPIAAPDEIFAEMKVRGRCEGTKWRVLS